MQNNIIWEGLNDESIENCNVLTNDDGYEVNSTISVCLEDNICNIEYHLKTNKNWESQYCKITNCYGIENKTLELQRLPGNKWMINGSEEAEYNGFDGLDISVTPFTNTLIVNRRQLREEESINMRIIYIDPLKMQCEPIAVRYTKLSESEFEYENLTSGFNVVLDVDDDGLVINYPRLFKMLQ